MRDETHTQPAEAPVFDPDFDRKITDPEPEPPEDVPMAEESKPRRRRAKPRASKAAKEGAKSPASEETEEEVVPINLKPIRRSLKELKALCEKAIDANDAYKEAIVATSKRAGLRHTVVKQYVNACVMDKYNDMQQKAEQLSLLFTEI